MSNPHGPGSPDWEEHVVDMTDQEIGQNLLEEQAEEE